MGGTRPRNAPLRGAGPAKMPANASLRNLFRNLRSFAQLNYWLNLYLYYKYKFLKIDDIYNYEVGKFMYLNDIKALPQIFENSFYPLI